MWSLLLLFSGTFDTLTDTLIFVAWFFYAANAWAVIVLRRPIGVALGRGVRRLRAGPVEVEFDQELAEVRQ